MIRLELKEVRKRQRRDAANGDYTGQLGTGIEAPGRRRKRNEDNGLGEDSTALPYLSIAWSTVLEHGRMEGIIPLAVVERGISTRSSLEEGRQKPPRTLSSPRHVHVQERLSLALFATASSGGWLLGWLLGYYLARKSFLSSESHRVCGAEGGGMRQRRSRSRIKFVCLVRPDSISGPVRLDGRAESPAALGVLCRMGPRCLASHIVVELVFLSLASFSAGTKLSRLASSAWCLVRTCQYAHGVAQDVTRSC